MLDQDLMIIKIRRFLHYSTENKSGDEVLLYIHFYKLIHDLQSLVFNFPDFRLEAVTGD